MPAHRFAVEVPIEPLLQRAMKIHLHLYCFDDKGVQTGVISCENRAEGKPLRIETPEPAAEVGLCLYVVPRGLPESRQVSDSPPQTLTLKVWREGELIDTLQRTINRFGGDQLIDRRYR